MLASLLTALLAVAALAFIAWSLAAAPPRVIEVLPQPAPTRAEPSPPEPAPDPEPEASV